MIAKPADRPSCDTGFQPVLAALRIKRPGFRAAFSMHGARHGLKTRVTGNTLALALICSFTGCIIGKQNPAATQPATAQDPKTAQLAYWMDQPTVIHVSAASFDELWNACRDAVQADGFLVDRTDYREGILTTMPLVSKQFYEFWRNDVGDLHGLTQSSLGTMRRTVRFDIRRLDDGSYQATPRAVVERFTSVEKRITSVAQYREVFALTQQDLQLSAEEQDQPQIAPQYWYAVGRDNALERQLAASVLARIK
jgi:hypothetical protein